AAAPRLARFLFSHAAGNPRTYKEVIDQLIAGDFIRYAEGTWTLPDELPDVGPQGLALSTLFDAALESRIEHWSAPLRTLALLLSPTRRPFNLALCQRLVGNEPALRGKELQPLLNELVREAVLVEDHGGYTFARSRMCGLLYASLSAAQKRQQHGRIAKALIAEVGKDPIRGFEIGFHLLLAGEEAQARRHLNSSVMTALIQSDTVLLAVPDLWALLEHQRSIGASDEDVQFIEATLILAGYYGDPSLQDRLGDRVLKQMHHTLGLPWAARLRPWLGSMLALLVSVLAAWLRRQFKKPLLMSGSSPEQWMVRFVTVCAALSAGACFRLDASVQARILPLLAFARGLSPFNPLHSLCELLAVCQLSIQGRYQAALAGFQDQLFRVGRMALLTGDARRQTESALHFLVARNHLLRLDSQTMPHTELVAATGGNHDRMMAHLLRSKYHLHRGNLEGAKQEAALFDAMAARYGARWTADLMAAVEFAPYHLAGDVLGLKRTLHQFERLVAIAPKLATYREVVRAMYEGHRGRPDLALSIYAALDDALAPFSDPSWSLARGHQAECLNILGRHAQALAVCEAARAQLSPGDRIYVFAYQQLERESAQALAGLGRIAEAVQTSDSLLAECAGFDNPLINGLLHYDRARIACVARDLEAFERHASAAREAFASTANPALHARSKRLLELGRAAGLVALAPTPQAGMRLGLVRNARAERALDEVVETSGAGMACLYLMVNGNAVLSAQHGQTEEVDSVHRAVTSMFTKLDVTSERALVNVMRQLPSKLQGALQVLPLFASNDNDTPKLVAMLVLSDSANPASVSQLDLGQIASELILDDDTELAQQG
ncbi:MAG TPA: hypothetical protein VI299_05695, partial [Polyangiales bacterium]